MTTHRSQKLTAHALATSVMRGGNHRIVSGADWLRGPVLEAGIDGNTVRLVGETRELDVHMAPEALISVITFSE